jgi:hypothetical protein
MLAFAGPAAASGGSGSCLQHPAKFADTAVQGFTSRPAGLLETYPRGGVIMSAAVRRLAGSDIATVAPLAALAKEASVSQIVAIGVGLARATTACKRTRPDLAQRIADEVKRAGLSTLSTVFAAGLTSEDVVAVGDPDALGSVAEPPSRPAPGAAKRSDAQDALAEGPKDGSGDPPPFFGTGGIMHTVVKPVSPAR